MGLILHPAAAPFHAFKQICVAHPVCRLYSHHISERIQEAARDDSHHHQCALAHIQRPPPCHLSNGFVLNQLLFDV